MNTNKDLGIVAGKKLRVASSRDAADLEALTLRGLARLADRGLPAKRLSAKAFQALGRYAWPGGVDELEMVLERAIVLSAGETISAEAIVLPGSEGEAEIHRLFATASAAGDHWPTLYEIQREHFWKTFEQVGGDEVEAARLLGMDRRQFRRLLTEFRLTATVPFPGRAISLPDRRPRKAA